MPRRGKPNVKTGRGDIPNPTERGNVASRTNCHRVHAMFPAQRSDITAAFPIAVDAFLRLSRIHLQSFERLPVLRLDTARQAVIDLVATAGHLPQSAETAEPAALQFLFPRLASKRTM